MGNRAAGTSLAQAHPVPSVLHGPRRLGPKSRHADRAVRDRLLPRRGRGGPRGRGRPRPRRDHRAGPFPVPVPRRERVPPGDRARLSAPGHRASPRRRPEPPHGPFHGDPRRRYDHRARHGVCLDPGSTRRHDAAAAGPCDPGDRPRTGAAGQPYGRSGRAGQRRGIPADRLLLRPAPRRLPQYDRPAVRQPVRAESRPARRRSVRSDPADGGRASGSPATDVRRYPAMRWICSGKRPR